MCQLKRKQLVRTKLQTCYFFSLSQNLEAIFDYRFKKVEFLFKRPQSAIF